MARELRIELNDDEYKQLARERHEGPTVYAGRVLAQELSKARFLEGGALFLATPGVRDEFTSRFGPSPAPQSQRRRRTSAQWTSR
ncbi:hypothetical protein O3S80_07085 [Streptomyces sp. Lzd4kr]|nr:hypothetical protein [Streptomyces sp. Lzd4kr]